MRAMRTARHVAAHVTQKRARFYKRRLLSTKQQTARLIKLCFAIK